MTKVNTEDLRIESVGDVITPATLHLLLHRVPGWPCQCEDSAPNQNRATTSALASFCRRASAMANRPCVTVVAFSGASAERTRDTSASRPMASCVSAS